MKFECPEDFPLPFIFSHLQLDTAMAKQNNKSVTTIQEEDELVLPDKIVYPLQGAETKEKTAQHPFRKYTPKPPVNSQQTQPVSNDNADPLRTHRGKKYVRPAISATLPGRSAARISLSSVKPKSDPVQMPLGFQCPAIPVQTYDEKACVDSDHVQRKVSKIRSKQGDEDTPHPQSLPEIRHPGNLKKPRAIAALTASVKRQESEEKRRTILLEVCKDVEGLPPRHKLIMKEGQWRPVLSAQHRKPNVPSMEGSNGRETKKGTKRDALLEYNDRRTGLLCLTRSAPLQRQSPKTSSNRASPSPGKAYSAPAKMSSAFHWPTIQKQSGFGQGQNRTKTRRMRLQGTKSIGPDLSTNGPSRSNRTDCYVLDENYSENVFDQLTPTAGSQAPKVVNNAQKTLDCQNVLGTAGLTPTFAEGELNVPKYVHNVMSRSSPDSVVAQLIANSKELTLYDSTESPSLQERKKRARAIRKKTG